MVRTFLCTVVGVFQWPVEDIWQHWSRDETEGASVCIGKIQTLNLNSSTSLIVNANVVFVTIVCHFLICYPFLTERILGPCCIYCMYFDPSICRVLSCALIRFEMGDYCQRGDVPQFFILFHRSAVKIIEIVGIVASYVDWFVLSCDLTTS